MIGSLARRAFTLPFRQSLPVASASSSLAPSPNARAMGCRRVLLLLVTSTLFCGCEKAMQNMYEQPKYKPLTPSPLWSDGRSSRPLEPGVIVHSAGVLAATSSGRRSEQPPPLPAQTVFPLDDRGVSRVNPVAKAPIESARPAPSPITMDTLRRGRDRFDIFCAPCHSVTGDGDGIVVRRGFPQPLSLHTAKLRAASDAHLFDVISYGYGVMYPFEDRISVPDRWAIVTYIRALQLSQNARLDDLSVAERNAIADPTK